MSSDCTGPLCPKCGSEAEENSYDVFEGYCVVCEHRWEYSGDGVQVLELTRALQALIDSVPRVDTWDAQIVLARYAPKEYDVYETFRDDFRGFWLNAWKDRGLTPRYRAKSIRHIHSGVI